MVTGKPGLKKLVYAFSEGDASLTDLLGGKGSNLCEMFRLGLPVPPGFVISTETCLEHFNLGNRLPDGLTDSIRGSVGQIGSKKVILVPMTYATFGHRCVVILGSRKPTKSVQQHRRAARPPKSAISFCDGTTQQQH